jgi:hypothetical protein
MSSSISTKGQPLAPPAEMELGPPRHETSSSTSNTELHWEHRVPSGMSSSISTKGQPLAPPAEMELGPPSRQH